MARSVLWHWAAQAFWPPQASFLAALGAPRARLELHRAAVRCGDGRTVAAALVGVWQAADSLGENGLSLAQEHTSLFADPGLVSPHETSYALASDHPLARETAAVSDFYVAFGFQGGVTHSDLAHVATELEFVAALLASEAQARTEGRGERALMSQRGRRKFLREHLARWFPAFAEHLAHHRRLAFYPAVAALVLALLATEPLDLAGHTGARSR